MGYASRLEGTLSLHPFPEGHVVAALREALAAFASPSAGRLALTPLGHGLTIEDTLDWTAGVEAVERARETVFMPRGIAIAGTLRAIGEDDTHLATITIGDDVARIEWHEDAVDEEKEAEWAAFHEMAEEEGLTAYLDDLVRLCVPSLRLRPVEESDRKSRIGGLPDVPAGFVWPVSAAGEPLTFVAQVDLEEVHAARLPGAELLPESGMLSFFHGHEPSSDGVHPASAGRVLFFDGALDRARAPAHPSFTAIPDIEIAFDVQTEELPSIESPFYALMLAGAGALEGDPHSASAEVFGAFVDNYGQRGVRDADERPVHRLLGYADPLQSDVYLATEGNATRLPLDAWGTVDHLRAAARWRLLLEIDSDPGRDVLFGDNGVLAFMIREEDLAARRFDRAWVEWQSH